MRNTKGESYIFICVIVVLSAMALSLIVGIFEAYFNVTSSISKVKSMMDDAITVCEKDNFELLKDGNSNLIDYDREELKNTVIRKIQKADFGNDVAVIDVTNLDCTSDSIGISVKLHFLVSFNALGMKICDINLFKTISSFSVPINEDGVLMIRASKGILFSSCEWKTIHMRNHDAL